MKLTYHLRISNKSTNKILFKTWFYNVTYREAMYKAQEYLMKNTWLKNNFHSGIEIILFSKENGANIMRQMKWINPPLSNRCGYFEGWDYYKNGTLIEKDENPKIKTAFLTTIAWSIFLFFILTIIIFSPVSEVDVFFGFLTFLLGVIYSSVLPLHKSLFNDFVENKKQMVLHNMLLELPIWLAGAATVIIFFDDSVSSEFPAIWVVSSLILLFTMKILIEVELDSQKLHEKKLKNKTSK